MSEAPVNYSTEGIEIMLAVTEHLQTGAQNAQTLEALANATGHTALEVNEAVEELQAQGELVVKDAAGAVYIAATWDEWLDYKRRHLTAEALQLARRRRAMGGKAKRRFLGNLMFSTPPHLKIVLGGDGKEEAA
jgi:hypothetical protein